MVPQYFIIRPLEAYMQFGVWITLHVLKRLARKRQSSNESKLQER